MADKGRIVFFEPKSPYDHIFSRVAIPRLGPLVLGRMLHKAGYGVRIYIEDMMLGGISNIRKAVQGAMLVAVSSITSTIPRAYWMADQIRAMGIPVAMGGVHPTFMSEEALKHADYVVRGEGERAIMPLVEAIEGRVGLSQVPNLSYLDRNGQIVNNPMADFIADLDEIPSLDYQLVEGWSGKRVKVIPVATSRGCPYNCAFCSVVPMFGREYRHTSMERAVVDLTAAAKRGKHVFVVDDNFTANPERTKRILDEVLRRGLKLKWSAQVRVEAARDDELLRLMAKSGCFMVFIGFESINPKTLKFFNKKQTREDIEEAIRKFHKYGIKVHGMFVLGSDNDDLTTIQATAQFATKMGIDTIQLLILTPLPGTRVYRALEEEGRIFDRDWSHYDAHHAVYLPKQLTPYQLQKATFEAMAAFYSRWSITKRVALAIGTLSKTHFLVAGLKGYGYRQIQQALAERQGYIEALSRFDDRYYVDVR